jgi:hypothetical protein
MDAAIARRIERTVERAASVLFGAAAAYTTYAAFNPSIGEPLLGAYCGGAGGLGFLLSLRGLIAIGAGEPRHAVPVFDVRTIDPLPLDELILADADRLKNEPGAADVLVLDDIVAELEPNSRVVRLFDREAMPTPGQLKQQIDHHLAGGAVPKDNGDAAQALSDALSELRRSLR